MLEKQISELIYHTLIFVWLGVLLLTLSLWLLTLQDNFVLSALGFIIMFSSYHVLLYVLDIHAAYNALK